MRMLYPLILARSFKGLAAASQSQPFVVHAVSVFLGRFTYLALVITLMIAGTGLPLPEDVPLVLSGYLCSEDHSPIRWVDSTDDSVKIAASERGIPNVGYMMIAGMIGVLAGDSIVFGIGRKGIDADNFVARHLRKVLHSKRRAMVERHFARHGNLTVFVGRFLPVFRGPTFAFAGLSKMSYPRFLLIDGMAAAISVPLFIYVGYYFADRIEELIAGIEHVKHIVLPILAVVLIGAGVIWYMRRKRARAALENL